MWRFFYCSGSAVRWAVFGLSSERVSTDLSPAVNGGAVSSRGRMMKRSFCIAFIVASVLVVRRDEPTLFIAFTMMAQDT